MNDIPSKADKPSPPKVAPESIRQDLAAWFNAKTPEEKAAAVKQFPNLRQVFAEAQNIN